MAAIGDAAVGALADSSQKVNAPMWGAMNLELSDQESEALARLLRNAIDDDRYPLSPRVQTLKAILAKIRPEPAREPPPPPQRPLEPPSKGRFRRRR
jgi:hypothetical protein